MRGGQARTRRGMLGMGKSRKDSDRRVKGKTTRANEGGDKEEGEVVEAAAGCCFIYAQQRKDHSLFPLTLFSFNKGI